MSDLCDFCGEWHADPMCSDEDERVCTFCGDPLCDGSGYNCQDGHYQEYNLRGWGTCGAPHPDAGVNRLYCEAPEGHTGQHEAEVAVDSAASVLKRWPASPDTTPVSS